MEQTLSQECQNTGMKTCSKCKVLKELSGFSTDSRNKDGRCGDCRVCRNEANRARYATNPEKVNAARRVRHAANPEKARAEDQARYAANPEKKNAAGRAFYSNSKKDPTKHSANLDRIYFNRIKSAFGLSKEGYIRLFESQEGKCDICGVSPAKGRHLAVDHDHTSGKVRGLLCSMCNLAVGHVKESSEIGRKLVSYIEKHVKPSAVSANSSPGLAQPIRMLETPLPNYSSFECRAGCRPAHCLASLMPVV